MENHEVVYRNLLEKRTISALADKVIFEFSEFGETFHYEFKYSDLSSNLVKGRRGDARWTTIGFYIVMGTMFVTFLVSIFFLDIIRHSLFKFIPLALLAIAGITFSLRLIKYDCVWFNDTKGEYAFLIKLDEKNRLQGEKTIDFILEKINQQQPKSEAEK